jgi:hypothetical protein
MWRVRRLTDPDEIFDASGLVLGGAWGLKEGIQRPLGTSSSMKLRINSILNACTRRGSFMGNNLGVLGKPLTQRYALSTSRWLDTDASSDLLQ